MKTLYIKVLRVKHTFKCIYLKKKERENVYSECHDPGERYKW